MSEKGKLANGVRKGLIIFTGILIIGIAITLLVCNYTYSEGSRAGVVIKFSKKGYLMKTYEGELNMGGMGNLPNTAQVNLMWEFSVKQKAVADTLLKLEGRKVSLHYREIVKNMPWQGDTKYFVDAVEVINP
jgi:hypothetical protein